MKKKSVRIIMSLVLVVAVLVVFVLLLDSVSASPGYRGATRWCLKVMEGHTENHCESFCKNLGGCNYGKTGVCSALVDPEKQTGTGSCLWYCNNDPNKAYTYTFSQLCKSAVCGSSCDDCGRAICDWNSVGICETRVKQTCRYNSLEYCTRNTEGTSCGLSYCDELSENKCGTEAYDNKVVKERDCYKGKCSGGSCIDEYWKTETEIVEDCTAEKWHDWFSLTGEIPMTGDFNNDGKDDIVTFTQGSMFFGQGDVYVALSDGNKFLSSEKWHDSFSFNGEVPVVGDFNGDGKDDIATVLLSSTGQVYVALSTGSGFGAASLWYNGDFAKSGKIHVGDFNNDGKDDIVRFKSSFWVMDDVEVALSTGSGFNTKTIWLTGFYSRNEIPMTGDFNNDSYDDIIKFKQDTGQVYVALSTGSGFGAASLWNSGFSPAGEVPRVGDFDGNGKDDIVTFTKGTNNYVYVALSTGSGFVLTGDLNKDIWLTGFSPGSEVPNVGDFNNDGKDDIVTFTQGDGRDVYDANVYVVFSDGSEFTPAKICEAGECKERTAVQSEIKNVTWTNMRNQEITQADLNDRVKLVVEGTALQAKNIEYTIYKGGNVVLSRTITALNQDSAYITWQANKSGSFHFTAKLTETGQSFKSGNLQVIEIEKNSPPVAKIETPKPEEIYFVNEEISFTQSSYDEDDNIETTWFFGDGENSTQYNTKHSYSIDGQKKILLKVGDERGLKAEDRASILIIDINQDKTYVMPLIHKPKWYETFLFASLNLQVWFNSTKSYVINVSTGAINCIAGPCPNQTVNGTAVSGSPKNITDNMKFEWKMSNNITHTGFGLNGSDFGVNFPSKGDKFSILNLTLNNFELAFVNFSINLQEFCYNGKWYDENGTEHNPVNEAGWCDEIIPACCPTGYFCSSSTKKCEPNPNPPICFEIYSCSNYTTESKCSEDICRVGVEDGDGIGTDVCGTVRYEGNIAWTITNCQCEWNSANNSCELGSSQIRTIIIDEPNPKFECRKAFTQSACVDGEMTISWTAKVINNNTIISNTLKATTGCTEGSKTVRCGHMIAMLPFFSLSNFIVAIIGIFVIYLIFWKKLKK